MWAERLKKITSFFLIFFLLFSFTLQIPTELFFASKAYAAEKEFYNLVSIIVDEDSYDGVKSKLVRYSRDIQGTLENTRVVIIPTPSSASVLDIASLNESLFFEGYKAHSDVDYESRLVGTVLVGKTPVPIVFHDGNSSKSILPYVDFEEKAYIYDHESTKYEKSESADTLLRPEIWHGVISPNTGTIDGDIDAMNDFFDKTHDFYTGAGVFDQGRGVIDGRDIPAGDSYEPHVFYYDQFRENASLVYQNYTGYQLYLQNIEDITYNRYSKDLAQRISDQILGIQNDDIQDLLLAVDPEFDISGLSNSLDVGASSDILTRYVTDNSTSKFLEVFNGSTLGEMRKHVFNAGRYNDGGSRVNMDMPPFLISVLDQVSSQVIKNVNTSLETEITNIVKNGLSRDIVIPLSKSVAAVYGSNTTVEENGNSVVSSFPVSCGSTSRGFYFGKVADSIQSANECSIYRGSTDGGTLVESNRGYNIENADNDVQLCGAQMGVNSNGIVNNGIQGYWGGNTPAALSGQGVNYTDFNLSGNDLKGGIRPVFDPLGAKEISDASKVPSPVDCFTQGVFIQTYKEKLGQETRDEARSCELDFRAPVLGASAGGSWSCRTVNTKVSAGVNFDTQINQTWNQATAECHVRSLKVDGAVFRTHQLASQCTGGGGDGGNECTCPSPNYGTTEYKSIPSHILHTSPTNSEFGSQTQSLFTPSLPIDKNRYIDFIGAKGGSASENYGYQRIDFPQLFRVSADDASDLNLNSISEKVKQHLDEVSTEINSVINAANPGSLTGNDRDVYQLLSTGSYPSANVDLYQILQDKPLEIFTLDNQSKEISYFDTLVFAVYWNSLDTVSSKYKFIFQEYLSNEFEGNDNAFHLPKAKKSYETTYFAAPGDAQNMYIKLDPESKGVHPYADIISANLALHTTITSSNVGTPVSAEGQFECAPPDGVNIFQWIPAIICWLKEMLPPTIKISAGSCGAVPLTQEEILEISTCDRDENKNGISDCLEDKLIGGSLKLLSDAGRYYYHSSGILISEIYKNDGALATFDSNSYISHGLTRVVIPQNPDEVFDASNSLTIYDKDIAALSTPEALERAEKYISFTPIELRAQRGGTKTYFYTKGRDANIYLESSVSTADNSGNIVISLESNELALQVRGDRIFINSYGVEQGGDYIADSDIIASHEANICLVDGGQQSVEESAIEADSISGAKEKLLLMLHNYSEAGNSLSINYPISVELLLDNQRVFLEEGLTKENLSQVYPLLNISRSGQYEIHIRDGVGFHSYRVFHVLSEKASKIDTTLSTNIIETGGNISTHLLTILDEYDNAATGEIYNIDMSLSGGGLVFADSGEDSQQYNVVEGYKAFRLKSTSRDTQNTLTITVRDLAGNLVEEETHALRTVDEIKLNMSLLGSLPKVGGETYTYNVEFLDEDDNLLTDLDSRVYFGIKKIYGKAVTPYVNVEGGKAEVSFKTSTLAARNIDVELQLEGGNDIYRKAITILPDLPITVDIHLSRDRIEASPNDQAILQTVLKDRYSNDVFTDDTTIINLELHEDSRDIITANALQATSSDGKAQFQISGTDIPGIGYFKVSTNPSLSLNSFDLIGQAPFAKGDLSVITMTGNDGALTDTGKLFYREYSSTKYISRFATEAALIQSVSYQELSNVVRTQVLDFWRVTNSLNISGIGENAGSLETFFFWSKDDIDGNAYNGLYSVLLGAPYGDITQENYLAGAMLFDRDNSSLAVSSLLNTPYNFHDIISISTHGNLQGLRSGDITQDIEISPDFDSEGRLIMDIHNEALETYIGRAYYNISDSSDITLGLHENSDYSVELDGEDARVISPTGITLLEAYEIGRFERKSGLSLQINENFIGEGISLSLMHLGESIGELHISGDLETNVTRDEGLLATKLNTLDNTIILHLASNQYSTRKTYLESGKETLHIYYQDPFASKYSLSEFHNNDITGLESSYSEFGIGWQESNTMLLNFSAGESVGDATKNFHSFSLINLGDPVASLKPLKNTFRNTDIEKSFDSTVGTLIESDPDLIGYQVFDYNNDSAKDLITIHRDGYAKLYENEDVEGGFIHQRNLVFAADGGSVRMVKTGDFSGDGYDDIFFVTDRGEPALFNNHVKDFERYDISESIVLSGAIIQAESYDMDSDGKDDIITLDDAGEIHIFYGNGVAEAPDFEKKFIGDGYAIELSNTTTSHGGGIYFDGLVQLSDERSTDILTNSQQYLQELGEVLENGEEVDPEFIDESLVESFLYLSLPYNPTSYESEIDPAEVVTEVLTGELDPNSPDASSTNSSVTDFLSEYENYVSYGGFENSYNVQTYFLRSQYADSEGLEITKTFTDTTPTRLQTGDRVFYDISIKNTSSVRKNNIAYVDSIPKYFHFLTDDFTVLTQDNKVLERQAGISEYEILLEGFYLDPGEETIVRFELETLPLSYGFMQVGLYEDGEVGDDIYGDIILKEDEQNCGRQADIYRSTAMRSYVAGTTLPTCNESDIEVGNQFPELVDEDGNGVPDYLDGLLDAEGNIADEIIDGDSAVSDDFQRVLDYGDEIREELGLDSDGDGIPDSDDSMDNTDSAVDFMGALDEINGAIDELSEEIDELIEGLSCGFGGGGCIATPLNWAPLAPGSDPTLFGKPIGDGLKIGEGVPIFSALTGRQTSCGTSPCCLPSVYPMTSATFIPGPFCGGPGAGGSLGINSPTNFVRLFATPTLTGGFGIAVCFGAPASAAGYSNPPGIHPIVPGGNCIVAALPLMSCEGGEGDPGVLGYPYPGNGFGIIHANCDGATQDNLHTPLELESEFVLDYLEYLKSGEQPAGMYDRYLDVFSEMADGNSGSYYLPSEPLINIGGGGDSSMSTTVDLDVSALGQGNFSDVIQIKNKRVKAFPGFLMDWVERQLDEITSKLTNLPKVFVILPDFGGIFDFSWDGFSDGLGQAFEDGKNKSDSKKQGIANQITALRNQKSGLNCSGEDALRCKTIDLKIASETGKKYAGSGKETLSGIKEVYEFIGNIPLINLETETISVNVPWIEVSEIDRFSVDWSIALAQWKAELASKGSAWSGGATCSGSDAEIARCQQENDIKKKAYADVNAFIASLERNIQILEEYKQFPDKLAKLINIKEVWLEQILCNIEAISKLVGEWVSSNGERFKAWVELYILIKAILKSWQLFIDVFKGYEQECHECKNERQDLQDFTFQLISAVIPSAPIIQFPKWPDIILDLHNIRAGMTVYMPDFDINLRPIVLPTLPTLSLPDVPSVGFSLPALPILPTFELPELPELPSLPSVELPDLPPPPKIPKLFGSVEGMLNIMKLVTKAMCILKSSPFVPEWRAGDQIAFLTERNGYIPTDFINIQPPTFSYSAISAIKVTTYVNLEFEMEFILEAVRSITAPLDEVSNNIANMFDISLSDINLSEALPIPSDINLDIGIDGETDTNISFAPLNENPEGLIFIVGVLSGKFIEFIDYLGKNSHKTMTNNEFKKYVGGQLASKSFTENSRTQEIRDIWEEVLSLTYSAENEFIAQLQDANRDKFQTIQDIISTEIQYSQKQQRDLENLDTPSFIQKVAGEKDERNNSYKELLDPHSIRTIDAAINLVSGESEEAKSFREDIEVQGENLMERVRGGLSAYKENSLRASNHESDGSAAGGGTCHSSGAYQYVYEGIYVLEEGRNYKLFDYTDLLKGNEEITLSDLDGDGDDDVLYLLEGKLYFKESRKQSATKNYLSLPPLILQSDDNKFFNGDVYYEAINGFTESSVSDGAINIEFQKPTNPEIKNFRMTYNTIVDRYQDESNSFIPSDVQTHVVDAIADIDSRPLISTGEEYSVAPHLATLVYAGGINDITLTNEKLINIKTQLADNVEVTLTADTKIYASDNDFEIEYISGDKQAQRISIGAYQTLSFHSPVEIVSLSGNAYVSLGIFEDIQNTDLINYIGMPLLAGAHLEYSGNDSVLSESSHVDIRYYDGSEIKMDIRDVDSYRLYDLGDTFDRDYRIRLEVPNDFYYARIHGFKDGLRSTLSRQILLAPQIYSDTLPPQIGLTQKIRIPVYQSQKIDLTPYIYEDGGLSGISEVRVDFDLTRDSDDDGNIKNDSDSENIVVTKSPIKIEIEFGPYDELFEKDIVIALVDDNGNIGSRKVGFEVYPPTPTITDIEENTITGVIDEDLLNEPVRLYRYRGGIIEKLQASDGTDLIETDADGNYDFETTENAEGLVLSYSGSSIATIDEYTGRVDISDVLVTTKILATNNPENTSIYPEIQLLRLGTPIFRQFVKVPEGEVEITSNFTDMENTGMYMKLLQQEDYSSFRVPLGVSYNPGSVSVYQSTDAEKAPVMTVFRDGRIHIDRENYKLEYKTEGEYTSIVLINTVSGQDIAQIVYFIEASYVLR